VAGTYLVSFFTKILSTGGMWLWNANYIATDLIKTKGNITSAGSIPATRGILRSDVAAGASLGRTGFFASGALLEATAFLALANRRLGF
jgi:hypothetical protein